MSQSQCAAKSPCLPSGGLEPSSCDSYWVHVIFRSLKTSPDYWRLSFDPTINISSNWIFTLWDHIFCFTAGGLHVKMFEKEDCYWLMDGCCVLIWQGLLVRGMSAVRRRPLPSDWLHVWLCGTCCLGFFVIVKNSQEDVGPAGVCVNVMVTSQIISIILQSAG